MGGCPARYHSWGRPLRKLVALLLGVLLLAACTGPSRHPRRVHSLAGLDQAITGLVTARTAVLHAVDDVQAGARALDATDAVCAKGHGVTARTTKRQGAADVTRATIARRDLPRLVADYRTALSALDAAHTSVSGRPRTALERVVRDGELEASAVGEFSGVLRTAWEQYASLEGQESVWITRAVSGWYRSDKEAADAYSVLVQPGRRFLTVARTQLQQAAAAVRGPIATEAATLAAADRALATLRKPAAS